MKKAIQIIVNNTGGIGARTDEDKYKEFFQSLEGGAWLPSEILPTLYYPTRQDVLRQLVICESIGIEYLVIVFSGHGGFINNNKNTMLCLAGEGERTDCNILDRELLTDTQRRLVILDCCRSRVSSGINMLTESAEMVKAGSVSQEILEELRSQYDEAILSASLGTAILYACAPGFSTTGIDGEGGIFSNRLKDVLLIRKALAPYNSNLYTIANALEAIKDRDDLYYPQAYYDDDSLQKLPWFFNIDNIKN